MEHFVDMATSPTKRRPKTSHPEFRLRMHQAADGHPHVPPHNYGRLKWFQIQLQDRFGKQVSAETVRKWFAGEGVPRTETMRHLAEILQVDEAWLALGRTSGLNPKERRLRNAAADGGVNLVAGLIQMCGSSVAFPAEDDERAREQQVDLYAIIRGAQYAIHVVVADRQKSGGWKVAVPIAALELMVVGVLRTGDLSFRLVEFYGEDVSEMGERRSGAVEIAIGPDLRTRAHAWKEIETFATRL